MSTQHPEKSKNLLQDALVELRKTKSRLQKIEAAQSEAIAVVGMGCRFPGGVDTPDKLWDLLKNSVDAITDMVDERWNAEEFYDPNPEAAGKVYTKGNGLVQDVDMFDAEFFGIAPLEAKLMDPQQRLLLEATWHALEHGGIAPQSLYETNTGVFVGICHQGYSHLQAKYCGADAISPYTGTGNAHSIASGRLSYLLGLHGPSVSVDTACSSSLVALHLAVQSLRKGESDVALAGGVNLILEPTTSMIFAKAGMLAKDGRCKTFDADADGYVRGEGCGMVVLKRLRDAEAAGDRILAVIKGTAVNQDGRSQGITAPNERAQEKVIRAALQDANVATDAVSYVEAHGTGTSLGDPIELAALNTVYGPGRSAQTKLRVGSIKTNIGHLEAAAGIAGFMKVVMSLQRGELPPHLHFKKPNPYVDWSQLAIEVTAKGESWQQRERVAGLSSFGFSGTNAHIIIAEAPTVIAEAPTTESKKHIEATLPPVMLLSAKSPNGLRALVDGYLSESVSARLQNLSWAEVCHTANAGRNAFRCRLSVRASSFMEAARRLQQWQVQGESEGISFSENAAQSPRIAFFFSGQGSQYAGMAEQLYQQQIIFRDALDRVAGLISEQLELPLLSVLWGNNSVLIHQTQFTQPAIFAVQYALTEWWKSLGIQPAGVLGHSIGEYAAAVCAGVLQLTDAVRMICARGHLMHSLCQPGAMAVVFASTDDMQRYVNEAGSVVSIAAMNGPRHCVISGEKHAVQEMTAILADANVKTRMLDVSHAFHSTMMEPMLEAFRTVAESVEYSMPRIRFVSSKTGKSAVRECMSAQYWVSQVSDPVRFAEAVSELSQQKFAAMLEIGPGSTLIKLAQQSVSSDVQPLYLNSLESEKADAITAANTIAELFCGGFALRMESLAQGQSVRRVDLPVYPYQKQSFWIDEIRIGRYHDEGNHWRNDLTYQTEWLSQPALAAVGAANKWVVVGNDSPLAAAIERYSQNNAVAFERWPLANDGEERTHWMAHIETFARTNAAERTAIVFVADNDNLDFEAVPAFVNAQLQALRALSQSLSQTPSASGLKLWLLTHNAYSDSIADGQVNLVAHPLMGWCKSFALEHSEHWGGMIDIVGNDDETIASQTLPMAFQEVAAQTGEDQVRLTGSERQVLRLKRASIVAGELMPLDSNANYLITGGLGGLGLSVAQALAASGAKHLVLVSRRGNRDSLNAEQTAVITQLESQGVSVALINADVAKHADVAHLVEQIDTDSMPLKGIVHAAGISEICTIDAMRTEQLHAVTAAKIDGAWHLHQATMTSALDFFVMFSSIASVWGSGGLAHYAAANHFLDGLAAYRRQQKRTAMSVQWGPWQGAGMAAGDAKDQAEKRGLKPLEPAQAQAFLRAHWSDQRIRPIVVDVEWERFRALLEVRRPHPLLAGVVRTNTAAGVKGQKSTFLASLANKDIETRTEAIVEHLRAVMARVIGADSLDRIDPDQPLMDLGLDSIMALDIKKQLELETGETVQATLIFDYPTVRRIAEHFARTLYAEETEAVAVSERSSFIGEPIAIIGIGSRLPKAPNGPGDFWNLLINGESGICDVPSERWKIDDYLDADENAPGKAYTLAAGLIDELESFDARFFGIAPREIESMEPQQRLVLETSWTALENAGYAPLSLAGKNAGVFVGVGANEYVRACALNAKEEDIMFIPTGNATNVIAGRVSFTLGLQGPAMAIDTACSSSAVAIHTACQSLRNGECELALAGGVNAIVLPETFVALSKAHMLSKSGRCKTFDEKADGYVRGEGVGILVLKRLSDAQRDGDNIIAVIRGSAVNQDGRSSSLTAPNGPAQQAVIRAALQAANVMPEEVDWIETHGTGTPLGDPIEVQSLDAVYGEARKHTEKQGELSPLLISAVKTNIGHLESAAAVSSVIKVALSLQHGQIPSHLHFSKFNPHIAVDASRFKIPVESTAWPETTRKRLAGVSSFGFSGTNVHLILEAAPETTMPTKEEIRQHHVLTISAKTEKSLERLCKCYAEFLEKDNLNATEAALADIAFSANTGREHFDHRVALVCTDKVSAIQKLKQQSEGITPPGVYASNSSNGGIKPAARVTMLFTGQGSQYAEMGKSLYEQYLPFRVVMDTCDRSFREETGDSLFSLLWGELSDQLSLTQYTQPALFCLEYALASTWLSLGVKPHLMIGHSVGEYAAAVLAGIMSLQDGMRLIVARGRLMVQLTTAGDMAAIMAPVDQVETLLSRVDNVAIAACNAPTNTVVSGSKHGIEQLLRVAEQAGLEARALSVSHAFHSPMMLPMLDAFSEVAQSITFMPATREIISTVSGTLNQGEMSTAAYWIEHVKRPVLFASAVSRAMENKPDILLEVGPGTTLLGLAQQNVQDDALCCISSLRPRQDACRQFCLAIAQLYSKGVGIQWAAFDAMDARRKVAVPSYAFDRKRYWLGDNAGQERRTSSGGLPVVGVQHENLLAMVSSPMSDDRYFENLFTDKMPFNLDDHRLYEVVVSPGAFHVAMAVTCARDIYGDQPVKLDDVVFPEPLIFEPDLPRRLHYGFKKQEGSKKQESFKQQEGLKGQTDKDNTAFFEVKGFSRDEAHADAPWTMHTSMNVHPVAPAEMERVLTPDDITAIQQRATHTVTGEFFYGEMWKVGYHLGPQFRWIEQIWRRPGEALTLLRLPQSAVEKGRFLIHPGLMDSCFQSSALATGHQGFDAGSLDAIYIPFALENLCFYRAPTTRLWCHVKIKNASAIDEGWAESFSHTIQVYDEQGQLLIDLDTLHSKRAPKEALLKALRKNPLENHYEIHWKEQTLKTDAVATLSGRYWVLGQEPARVNALAEQIRQLQGDVSILLLNGEEASTAHSLNWQNPSHWMQWVQANNGLSGVKGIVMLAPATSAGDNADNEKMADTATLLETQKTLYSPLLSLVKTLQIAGGNETPRLWCVTTQGVAAARSDTHINPGHSALHGFSKVLAMEHPEFNAVFVDVEALSEQRMPRMIAEELTQNGDEKLVACRRNGRWVARLARCSERSAGMPIPAAPYRLVVEKKGTFEDLKYLHFTPRQLGSTEVAVKVLSAGLNFRDVMGVLDVYPGEAGPLGGECIGEITQLGDNVSGFAIGDRVMVPLAQSCMSTQTQIEHLLLCKVPQNLSVNEAATIPVAYCTALYGLQELANLKAGERVLIHAGAGGVGLAAIYIAWQKGAEVIASASERKRDFLRALGVQHVVDSRSIGFADEVRAITQGEGIDVVLNSLAGEFIPASMALLRENGRFIEIGKADIWSQERVKAFRSDITYAAFDLVMVTMQDPLMLSTLMQQVVAGVEAGEYKPLPYTVFNQSEAVDAFRYMAQGRHVGKILINPDPQAIAIRADRSYLITGATGGLGLLFARWLATQGARELVLVARRHAKDTHPEQVGAIEAMGAKVHCVCADVGNAEDVQDLIQWVNNECQLLAGVIHAAGVLKDSFILNQTCESFEHVMTPKLAGAWHLHRATQALDLDMFVLFSSMSSMLGAPGQANYASANAFLDGLAHYRRARGLAATSIHWGPWSEVGMAANAQVEANAAAGGVHYIKPEEGLVCFQQILQANPVERGVFNVNWPALAKGLGGSLPSYLSELDVRVSNVVDGNLQKMAEEFRARLLDTPSDERTPMLVDMICDQIKRVMGLDLNEPIDPTQPLQALGLDSLMAVELRNILCALIGRQLPATLMFKYPTVASLSAYLIEDMFPREATPATVVMVEPAPEQEENLDHLSEEDLEAMLMAELGESGPG